MLCASAPKTPPLRTPRPTHWPALSWIVVLLLILGLASSASAQTLRTSEELREETLAYLDAFSAIVNRGADLITEASANPRVKKRALLWKVRMIPQVQDAALLDDPRQAYAAVIALTIAQRIYLTEGDGRSIFAEYQSYAIEAAREAEERARAIGPAFLQQRDLERLSREAEALVRKRPISGAEFLVPAPWISRLDPKQATFDWLLQVPMVPFRALTGVSDGAAAIRDFNDTALRFASVIESVPEQSRWQTELLLFDLENRDSVKRSLDALESLQKSAQVASASLDRLPKELQSLLTRSKGPIGEARATLEQARELAGPLEAATSNLRDAGLAWKDVFAPQSEETRAASDSPARPFDIREWTATFDAITQAAGELRSLAADVRPLTESFAGVATADDAARLLTQAQVGARDLVDHIALRALQLLLAAFALLVAYRLVSWKFLRSTRRSSPLGS